MVGVKREREEEVEDAMRRVCVELDRGLGPEYVSERAGPGGSQLPYLEGHHAVNLANLFFGVNNWSQEERNRTVDKHQENSRWFVSVTSTQRVTVNWPDGTQTYREGTGFGGGKGQKTLGEALEGAMKEAETDGLKRTLRLFGNALGNCLYDAVFRRSITQMKRARKGDYSLGEWKETDLVRMRCNQRVEPASKVGGLPVMSNGKPGGVTVGLEDFEDINDEDYDF
jgi:DNA repair and recombination protein RAD52